MRVLASEARCSALAGKTAGKPLPANSVQVAPLSVVYHHEPWVVSAAVMATPGKPGIAPSWAPAPSASSTLPLLVSADIGVPTAPAGGPASPAVPASVTGTPFSTGESLAATISMAAAAAVVVPPVVWS